MVALSLTFPRFFRPVYGVTAKKTIPKRTQFGPMEGILVRRDRGSVPPNPTGLVLSVDNGGQLHTVDVSNPG